MACLAIVVVLALVALVVLMMHQWRRKRLTLRWWAVPAILIVGAASFPQSVVTTLYFLIQAKVMAPYDLALWITDAWREYGRYAAFVWVVGFPFILWRKGVVFDARRDAVRSVAVAILIMLPLTVFDSSMFWAANRPEKTDRISSVSPDGRRWVIAIGTQERYSTRYTLLSEENVPHPWLARHLASVVYPRLHDGPGFKFTGLFTFPRLGPDPQGFHMTQLWGEQLAWSADSRVVILIAAMGNEPGKWAPYLAYDFSGPEALIFAYGDFSNVEYLTRRPIDDEVFAEKKKALELLLNEHGGLAPQAPAVTGSTSPAP
jgi:hypothetical protein